ncbi:MAG: hypothetical protein WCW13_00865 [archaeon]|jgi:hypothetical protein
MLVLKGPKASAKITANTRALRRVFRRVGLEESSLPAVAKYSNAPLIISRLRAMKAAKVPLTGIVYKVTMPEEKFRALLERFSFKYSFTSGQRKLFDVMISKGFSESLAVELCSPRMALQSMYLEKIDFFESFKLDPKVYGVERIPPSAYSPLLKLHLRYLKARALRPMLTKLADEHASKVLDEKFPGWRELRSLQRKKGHPGGRIHPSSILKKVRAFLAADIEPTLYLLEYSLSRAKEIRRGQGITGNSALLRNTPLGRGFETRLEKQIRRLNKQIQVLEKKFVSRWGKPEVIEAHSVKMKALREELKGLIMQKREIELQSK